MSVRDKMKYIDKAVFYKTGTGLTFDVIINDVRSQPYDASKTSFQIKPAKGSGLAWVSEDSIKYVNQ